MNLRRAPDLFDEAPGGVVHTLNLAEALAASGVEVTVWSLARPG